jgi:polyisoprenoid-binding protein YceI
MIVAGLALMAASVASAEVHTFQIDGGHSSVGFSVRHLVSKVQGRFGDFDGKVMMDPASIEKTLKIDGTIQAASIDTGIEKRDGHLKSADFFDAEKFPTITFTSKKVEKKGDKYAVTGDLTMRGVTKEVTLNTEVLGVTEGPAPIAGIELTGKVNRKEFGINWNKALDNGGFVLGDDVDFVVNLEAKVPAAEPAAKS